ncbi:MAG: hypothetical protein ACK40L_11955, partial [Hydrogenophaga sp.]
MTQVQPGAARGASATGLVARGGESSTAAARNEAQASLHGRSSPGASNAVAARQPHALQNLKAMAGSCVTGTGAVLQDLKAMGGSCLSGTGAAIQTAVTWTGGALASGAKATASYAGAAAQLTAKAVLYESVYDTLANTGSNLSSAVKKPSKDVAIVQANLQKAVDGLNKLVDSKANPVEMELAQNNVHEALKAYAESTGTVGDRIGAFAHKTLQYAMG